MVTSPPTLEELFLRHYDEDIAASARDGAEDVTPR
jgi:hypothetical protein